MILSDDLYLRIPGLETVTYVRPKGVLPRDFVDQDPIPILYSPDINTVFDFLRDRKPNKTWFEQELARLRKEGHYIGEHDLRTIYWNFRTSLIDYCILGEPIDFTPQKRMRDYHLTDKNAVLYRKATIGEKNHGDVKELAIISVPKSTRPVPVQWPTEDGELPPELCRTLNAPPTTRLWTNPTYVKDRFDGVGFIMWHFKGTFGHRMIHSDLKPKSSYVRILVGK